MQYLFATTETLIFKAIVCLCLLLITVFLKSTTKDILNRWWLVFSILHPLTTATEPHHSLIFHRLPVAKQLNYTHTHTEASISVRLKIKLRSTVPNLLTKLPLWNSLKKKKNTFNSEADLGLSNFIWEIFPDHYILDILYSASQKFWSEITHSKHLVWIQLDSELF